MTIRAFIGDHKEGKTNEDVEALYFNHTTVHHFPKGLDKIFPNLKAVQIVKCGLKAISRNDLVGLKKISGLFLNFNQLRLLQNDLFEGFENLKVIWLNDNKLEFVSSKCVAPIIGNQLECVDFRNNKSINAVYDRNEKLLSEIHVDLQELMSLIDAKCKYPLEEGDPVDNFKDRAAKCLVDTWTSDRYSDFVIITSTRKFPVHKIILSSQSLYFNEIFASNTDELKMEDVKAGAVKDLLRYIYTGEYPRKKHAIEVFALAVRLNISNLKPIAENLVIKKLDKSNALEIFELGRRYDSEKLKKLAFHAIKELLEKPSLSEDLINQPENVRMLVEAKRSLERMLERFTPQRSDEVTKSNRKFD